MIFYFHQSRMHMIEYTGHTLILPVETKLDGRGNIRTNKENFSGWTFEADDYFQTFCMMKFGFAPALLFDDEWDRLLSDNIVFLSKERTTKFRAEVITAIPKNR